MPYYDTLGRYINPFYLDVHPDVRAELEMRAAFIASDFRSANTKSIEWPYQKMPWAHVVSVDFPNVRLGFSKEQLDGRNSDEQGDLILYTKDRNVPKIPLLTGVEISNMGQRGSLLKGKFSFTYFPDLTIDGFELEELQGALFTPGREVQLSFGWSVYAENPWVNKLEFKGIIYGFNWTVQPNLSIAADVEIVSATTIALGLSGDQSVLPSDQSDIVMVDGWNSELKGLNLLTVINKDLSIQTASLESGQIAYYPKEQTTEKLLDYYGIGMLTSEFEEVQNIVINNYDYDAGNWEGGGTPYGEAEQQGETEEELVEKIKKEGQQFFDNIWNQSGGREFSDPNSRWNSGGWRDKWEIIKEFYNNPYVKAGVITPYISGGSVLEALLNDVNTWRDDIDVDLGEIEYLDANTGLSKTLDFGILANNEQLVVFQDFDPNDRWGQDPYSFFIDIENNTKKLVNPIDLDNDGESDRWELKDPRPNVPNRDRIRITWKPNRSVVSGGANNNNVGEYKATLKVVLVEYQPTTVSTSEYSVPLKDPKTGKMIQPGGRFTGQYENKAKTKLVRYINVRAKAKQKRSGVDGERNVIDMNVDPFFNAQQRVDFGDTRLDILGADGNYSPVTFNNENGINAYTYKVGETYRLRMNRWFGFSANDGLYNGYDNAKIFGGNDEFEKPKLLTTDSILGKDRQKGAYIETVFKPKSEGVKTYYLQVDNKRFKTGTSTLVDIVPAQIQIKVGVGSNVRPSREDSVSKEQKDNGNVYDEAKKQYDDTLNEAGKDAQDNQPETENPTDTASTEEPITATNESEVKANSVPKTFWYVRLGSLVEFANKLIERYENDTNNKFSTNLFRIQAFNNEAEYNKYVRSAYPIDVFFPDIIMGQYGEFCPFNKEGSWREDGTGGNQVLRLFQSAPDKNGKRTPIIKDNVINIGQILVGVDFVKRTYDSFLATGGQNISLKNITKFFDEIVKMISTSTGEIYQFTTILFEEPEKLVPRSEYNQALENVKLRGGSRIEMADIFSYDISNKRPRAIVSIEDTNLSADVIKEGSVEPFKFDATMVRPMLKNVQVVSKPSKEMAAAAYIAARGQGAIDRGGSGQGIQNLEVTLNLKGFQNVETYKAEVKKITDELYNDLNVLGKAGWTEAWSELIRGTLIKLKRLTIEPQDPVTGLGTSWLNRAIYPIEFSVTLDGINGFKFGDVIKTSLIPKHYNVDWDIVFTVIKVVHKVTTSTWETTLYTAARLNADGKYASEVRTAYVR